MIHYARGESVTNRIIQVSSNLWFPILTGMPSYVHCNKSCMNSRAWGILNKIKIIHAFINQVKISCLLMYRSYRRISFYCSAKNIEINCPISVSFYTQWFGKLSVHISSILMCCIDIYSEISYCWAFTVQIVENIQLPVR